MTNGGLTNAVLIEHAVHTIGVTKRLAKIVVDTLFGSILEALHQEEKVELSGVASFRLRRRGPHRRRNPRTAERVNLPSRTLARFKPGKELMLLINRDPAQPVSAPLSE